MKPLFFSPVHHSKPQYQYFIEKNVRFFLKKFWRIQKLYYLCNPKREQKKVLLEIKMRK